MAFCTNCGQKMNEKDKFCANCGMAIAKTKFNSQTQKETTFKGKIYKCFNCGAVLGAFISNCPFCGSELRDVVSSEAIRTFVMKLEKAKIYQEKVSIIRNFPIPNTKEDILEFMILASSNMEGGLEKDLLDAWKAKIEQAYQKAYLVFKEEKEFSYVRDIYNQVYVKLDKKQKIQIVKNIVSELIPVLPNVVIIIGWLISIFVLLPLCGINLDNVGTNGHQLLLMIDFIVGAILIPLAFKCESVLPKLITSFGLILSIIILSILSGKNLDNIGNSAFQLLLIMDIICSAIIFIRMFKSKRNSENRKVVLNSVSFMISIICVVLFLIIYGIGSISAFITVNNNNIANEKAKQEDQSVTYEWPTSGLSQFLAQPSSQYGNIETDNETRFNIEVYQVSVTQFKDYIKACKEKGFTISTTETDGVFNAYHTEEYELDIFYHDDKETMEIVIDAPLEMKEIRWPNSKLVKKIPKPKSLVGSICWENSEYFGVYIANTTPEQYEKYVDKCMDKGFTIDYSRGDTTFHAYNKAGYYLVVKQCLFNKMYISIEKNEKE